MVRNHRLIANFSRQNTRRDLTRFAIENSRRCVAYLFPYSTLFLVLIVSLFMVGCSPKTEQIGDADSSKASKTNNAKASKEEPKIDPSIDIESLIAARLPKEELAFGWIRLFDAQSMMGWKPSSNANWKVDNGTLSVDSGEKGFLFTTSRFGDFELQLEFLADEKTNSGVFMRSPLEPKSPAKDCYELNIAPPDNPFPTGSLVERIKVNTEVVPELEPDEWHTLHAHVDGEQVRVWVDGIEAAEYKDQTKLTSGYIGLQFREGKVQFRNIRIRPIVYASLPTQEFKDWNPSSGEGFEAKFLDKGELRLKGGKGHVELLQSHGNFCLQARVRTLAEKVNSGIFFRCIPGEPLNGYECQVHHGFNGDRRLPADSGTGAIFRRQSARAVLSDEGQPAHVTLIADGDHFASWVEGVQVVDWTDDRPDDANPRKGKRLEAGTIQLQSHDATCDVVFESLGISPIQ
jgi:Domain of Unknown Function (DUF1080)